MALAKIFGRCTSLNTDLLRKAAVSYYGARSYRQHEHEYAKELHKRRLKVGPVEEVSRSQQRNWNEDVELHAFSHRVSEKLTLVGLRQAFTDQTYSQSTASLVKEVTKDLEQDMSPEADDDFSYGNKHLSDTGRKIAKSYITEFIKGHLPYLPEDGIRAIIQFLTSEEKLAYVGQNLGIKDLILYDGFPVPEDAIATAFLALIGVIHTEQGTDRANAFIRDFVISQLVGEDIDDIYQITNAMNKLVSILEKQGRGEPIPRLLDQCGQNTLVSCYYVGIYSDNNLIGRAFGETMEIAEDMAARDALMTFYGIQDHKLPLDFNITYKQFGVLNSGTQPTLKTSYVS